jgi:hypothetical protein
VIPRVVKTQKERGQERTDFRGALTTQQFNCHSPGSFSPRPNVLWFMLWVDPYNLGQKTWKKFYKHIVANTIRVLHFKILKDILYFLLQNIIIVTNNFKIGNFFLKKMSFCKSNISCYFFPFYIFPNSVPKKKKKNECSNFLTLKNIL